MARVVVYLPLRIVSVANRREHWTKGAARTADHRGTVRMAMTPRLQPLREQLVAGDAGLHVDVLLVRVAPKSAHRLDEPDNLAAAFKATRDGLTDALCSCRCASCIRGRHAQCGSEVCVDDSDPRIAWCCIQTEGGRYEVRIELAARATRPPRTVWQGEEPAMASRGEKRTRSRAKVADNQRIPVRRLSAPAVAANADRGAR